MDQQQREQIIAYIGQRLQSGESYETLRQTLQQYDLRQETIDELLREGQARSQSSPVETPASAADSPAAVQGQSVSSAESTPAPVATTADAVPQKATTATGKYRVFEAINDAVHAITRNFKTFVGVAALSYGISFALMLGLALTLAMSGQVTPNYTSIAVAIGATAVLFVVMLIVSLLIYTLVLTTTSIAVMDGGEGRTRTIKQTITLALPRLGRVALALVVQALIIGGPLIILALVAIAASMVLPDVLVFLLGALLYVAISVWMIVATLRYALIPYVALFEPDVRMRALPGRSFHLVKDGGQWFVFKGILLLFLAAIILSLITGQGAWQMQSGGGADDVLLLSLISLLANILLTVLMNAVLVMLYRNRRAVRG